MQHQSLMPTAVVNEVIEVRNTVLNGVLIRTWLNNDTIESDVRITADQARTLAANLLHAAQCDDGQRVSFKWHQADCTPAYQANGLCRCNGRRVAS